MGLDLRSKPIFAVIAPPHVIHGPATLFGSSLADRTDATTAMLAVQWLINHPAVLTLREPKILPPLHDVSKHYYLNTLLALVNGTRARWCNPSSTRLAGCRR